MSHKSEELEDKIVFAALYLAAERGWCNVSLRDIADRAEVKFVDLYSFTSSKGAIVSAFRRRIDEAMISDLDELDPIQPVRDSIFDIVMQRFDAMEEYRQGIQSIFKDTEWNPSEFISNYESLNASMILILRSAGLKTKGAVGFLKAHYMSAIWYRTLRIWLSDDVKDLSKTMAHLDRELRRAESIVHSLQRYFDVTQKDDGLAA